MAQQSNAVVYQLKKTISDIRNYNREWNYTNDFETMVQKLNSCSRKLDLPEFKFEHFHYSHSGKTINPTGLNSLKTHNNVLEEMLPNIFREGHNNAEIKESEKGDNSKKVFIVHGRDKTALLETEVLIRKIGLEPIVLHRMANSGLTLIEKFEKFADVKYAIVLLTPDDIGALSENVPREALNYQFRARQNVVFELGFFYGKLGRSNVCCLYKSGLELPTDINGVAYIPFNNSVEEVEYALLRELKEAKLEFQPF